MKAHTFPSLICVLTFSFFAPSPLPGADGKDPKKDRPGAADELFDQPRVLQLKIEILTPGLEALKREPNEYVKAAVREAGKVYSEVGVRLKGSGSFQPVEKKPSLTLKFNEFTSGTRFHGHTKILLNNCAQDPAYLCEAIGGDIFRAADVPAPKVTFARVELNGRDLGLYAVVEAVNHDFLSRHFKKGKGNLYEGSNADVNEKLEKDSGNESKDQADLKALANAAQESDPVQRLKKLATVLDVDRFISYAATEVLTWHHDGYTMDRNNYRIYHDPATDKMVFIPHGMDQLFDQASGPVIPEWKGLVAKAVLETSEGKRRYLEQMSKLLPAAFKVETLHARVNELAGKIRPALTGDKASAKAFDSAVAQLKERIAERAKFVEQQLKAPAK